MAILSPTELLEWLGQYQFILPTQVDEIRPLLPDFADSRALAKELVRRDWLTRFQAHYILQGKQEQLVLDNYRLRERIGEGAMGQVFKAWNPRMRRIVAVKTLHKELVSSSKVMDRFRREMAAASQLDHPNIARVRDAGEVEAGPYMVMDYIEGVNLSQRVKQQGPLPIHEAAEFARQAALGLQHAFEHGIVHRDIKPANLLVTTVKLQGKLYPLVKILDFGLARFDSENDHSHRLTQPGKLLGTVDYIAPEQAQNARTADIRADIYSLGCSLFYMLTGHAPFLGNTVVEKLGPRLTGEPPSVRDSRPDVPASLDAVLRKMMARRSDDRYQTPIEVDRALQPFSTASVYSSPPNTAEEVIALSVSSSASAEGNPPLTQPIPAMPVASSSRPEITTEALQETSQDASAESLSSDEENPIFLEITPTPHTWTARRTAGALSAKPFPLKLIGALGAGMAVVLALVLGLYLIGSFDGSDTGNGNKGPGAVRVTDARFSMPSKTVKPGETKRVHFKIERIDFKGPIKVTLKDLPDGINSEPLILPANADRGDISFTVSYGTPPSVTTIRLAAESEKEQIYNETTLELKVVEDRPKTKKGK